MRFRLRFYFILFVLYLDWNLTLFFYDILIPDRISQFLSQITCTELDLCDYNQTINVDEMNITTTIAIRPKKMPNKHVLCLSLGQ